MRKGLVVLGVLLALVLGACGDSDEDQTTYTVGVLDPLGMSTPVEGFKAGLAEQVTEATITYIQPEPGMEQLETAIDTITEGEPDLAFCVTTPACTALHAAAPDLSLVFVAVSDPIGAGLVESFSQPGGSATGIASAAPDQSQEGKRFEWLIEAARGTQRVLVPYNPDDPATAAKLAAVQSDADLLGIALALVEVRTSDDVTALIADLPDDVDAVFTFSERIYTTDSLTTLANAAIAANLPYCAPGIEYGALLSYNSDLFATGQQSARLAHQVLQGTAPADLPVELPEFFLRINMVTANAIGLDVPPNVLNAADEIVYPEDNTDG